MKKLQPLAIHSSINTRNCGSGFRRLSFLSVKSSLKPQIITLNHYSHNHSQIIDVKKDKKDQLYSLLSSSHEKKKMYWEQLEHRRRLLYRRAPAPNACSCCDDYGFVPPSELYPWAPWDTLDDRWVTTLTTRNWERVSNWDSVRFLYDTFSQLLRSLSICFQKL